MTCEENKTAEACCLSQAWQKEGYKQRPETKTRLQKHFVYCMCGRRKDINCDPRIKQDCRGVLSVASVA